MREIKFRAWDKVNSNMIYSPIWISDTYGERSGVIGLDGSVGLIFKSSRGLEIKEVKNQFILQQYTGLKDKNGKEIYEGDILKLQYPNKEIIVTISFEYGCFWFTGEGHTDCNWHFYNEYEIIGNIYENPELLV